MIDANDINRKSWIQYESDSHFPIQNIPFGVFKDLDKKIHIGTIIGDTIISLSKLEILGYFKGSSMKQNTFQSDTLNPFLKQKKHVWREIRNSIANIFDIKDKTLQNNTTHQARLF